VERVGALDEQHRIAGNGRAALGGMLAVVQADAQDVGWHQRRQQPLNRQYLIGEVILAQQIPLDSPGRFFVDRLPQADPPAALESNYSHAPSVAPQPDNWKRATCPPA